MRARLKNIKVKRKKSGAQRVMLVNVKLKNIKVKLKNVRARLGNMGLKSTRARLGNMGLKNTRAKLGNVKARFGNVRPLKFFSKADKVKHIQLHLSGPDNNIIQRQQLHS